MIAGLAVLLLSAKPMRAEDPPRLGHDAVFVGPLSFEGRVDRETLVRLHHVREALILRLRFAGFPVTHPTWERPALEFVPPERLAVLAPTGCVTLHLVSGPAGTRLEISDPAAKRPEVATLGTGTTSGLAVAEDVLARLGKTRKRKVAPVALEGPIDPEFFADEGRLDLGLKGRLSAIQAQLRALDDGSLEPMTFARLAVLSALHACYACRTDEIACLRWFGRAKSFIELARCGREKDETLARAQADIDILARRFATNEMPPADGEALLPEVRYLRRFLATDFETLETYPSIANLFDFLVRLENRLYVHCYEGTVSEFARRHRAPLDCGLIWGKVRPADKESQRPTVFSDGNYDGDAAWFVEREVPQGAWVQELAGVGYDLGLSVDRMFREFDEAMWENPHSMLDNLGEKAKARTDPSQRDVLVLLAMASRIERQAGGKRTGPRAEFQLDFADVAQELANRYVHMATLLRTAFRRSGWGDRVQLVDSHLDRFGRDRLAPLLGLEGLSTLPRLDTKAQAAMNLLAKKIRGLYAERRFAEASDLARTYVARAERNDDFLPERMKVARMNHTGVLQAFARAGRRDEGLDAIAAVQSSYFAVDGAREAILFWHRDGLDRYQYLFRPQTNSAYDKLTRAEYAFRLGDLRSVEQIIGTYHYGGNAWGNLLTTFARIRSVGRDADTEALWNNADQAMKTFLNSNEFNNVVHHWVPILDGELHGDPRWEALRKKHLLGEWATLNGAYMLLNERPGTAELARAHDTLKRLSLRGLANRDDPASNTLALNALWLDHQAVARLLLARAEGLEGEVRSEERELVLDLARRTRAWTTPRTIEGTNVVWTPIDTGFIFYLVRFGGEPSRVARFVSKIQGLRPLLLTPLSNRAIVNALGAPEVLEAVLASPLKPTRTDDEADFDFHLNALVRPAMDEANVFALAFKAGADDCALELALARALSERKLDRLRYYFGSKEQGRAWVEANALDVKTSEAWLAELELAAPEVDAARAARRASGRSLPETVPSLIEHLNPKLDVEPVPAAPEDGEPRPKDR